MSEENGKRSGVLHVAFEGMTVDFELTEKTVGQIEQFIHGLKSRGWTSPPQPARGGFGGRPSDRVRPDRNDLGELLCPTHRVALQWREWEGKRFLSCPAKATGDEKANARGYCALKFQES